MRKVGDRKPHMRAVPTAERPAGHTVVRRYTVLRTVKTQMAAPFMSRIDDDDFDAHARRSSRRHPEDDFDDDYVASFRGSRPRGNGMATTSMTLGIIALVVDLLSTFAGCIGAFCIVGFVFWLVAGVGFLMGVLAVVLGFTALRRGPSGMATAGIVTGICAILWSIALGVMVGLGLGVLANLPPPAPPNNAPMVVPAKKLR